MPRRYLLAVGVRDYASAAWPPLQYVPKELDLVTDVLTGRLGLERILEAQGRRPTREQLLLSLADWVASPERKRDDHLVVYWTGHGDVANERLCLVLPGTTDIRVNALDVGDMVDILADKVSRIGPVLLMLDVCFAGQAAQDIGRRLGTLSRSRPETPPEVSVICATLALDSARQLAFAPALHGALLSCIDPDKRLPPSLNLSDIVSKLAALLRHQTPFIHINSRGRSDFFPNPHHAAHWPPDIDLATQKYLTTLDPAARGVATPDDQGWFFTGRKRVLADLCQLIASERPAALCIVKGRLGAGKSAVLGRLYTLSRTDYLKPIEVLAETETPAPGSIDGAVVLTKLTKRQAITAIATALRVTADSDAQMVAELALRRRTTLILDGLDEAEAPKTTLAMLERLTSQAPVIAIIGVRSPGVRGERSPDLEIDLDAPPWSDHGAVADYAIKRLRAARHSRALPDLSDDDLEQAAHSIAARSRANFLLASLIVTDVVAGATALRAGEEPDFPVSVGDVFDRLLDRLGDAEGDARDLLLAVSYAEGGGFPKGALWSRIAKALSGRPDARPSFAALKKAPWFLIEGLDREGSVSRLFHAALAEHLQGGRQATRDHLTIATALREITSHPVVDAEPGEVGYARRNLSKHLRRAGAWRALWRLIRTPDWIDTQSGSRLSQGGDYAADLDEAHAAARHANLAALTHGQLAPALAPGVWRAVWRSGVVTQAIAIPPAGWAAAVRHGRISPEAALGVVTLIGDVELRAARFAALARELTGAPLQHLLDAAEGVGSKEYAPISHFEDILREAMAGPDAFDIAPRVLAAVKRMNDWSRWIVLERLLPCLDADGLAAVPSMLATMRRSPTAPWGALAFAAYVAERFRRGDDAEALRLMDDPPDEMSRLFGMATLLRARGSRDGATITFSALDGLARARTDISDYWLRLDIEAALVAGLTDLRVKTNRAALAGFLRDLRAVRNIDPQVDLAAVASDLPAPHGMRLLRWANRRLQMKWRAAGAINWYHTPAKLAAAFGRQRALKEALDIALLTAAHPYWRPKALAEAIRSFGESGGSFDGFPHQILDKKLDEADRLQLLCACIDWLGDGDKAETLSRLERHRGDLTDEGLALRGYLRSEMCRFAGPNEIDSLVQELISLAGSLSEWRGNELLIASAVNCASADHGAAARAALDRVKGSDIFAGWARVLADASDAACATLLCGLADSPLLPVLLENWTARDAVVAAIRRAPAHAVAALRASLQGSKLYWFDRRDVLAALAVRAFELGDAAGAAGDVSQFEDRLVLLLEAARLALEARRGFTRLADAVEGAVESPLSHALADLLCAGEAAAGEASWRFVEAALASRTVGAAAIDRKVIELIAPGPRARFVDTLVEEGLSEAGVLGSDLDWLLPYLSAGALVRLVEVSQNLEDDHGRDEALVRLLPRCAELYGLQAALELRGRVRRHDFQARSWASIWPHLTTAQVAAALTRMTPEKPLRYDRQAEALATIAPLLTSPELCHVLRWTVRNHDEVWPELVEPFLRASLQQQPQETFEALDALLEEAGRRPREEAIWGLVKLAPLIARLGGRRGLQIVERAFVQASARWP
jgi:hypothetical protein